MSKMLSDSIIVSRPIEEVWKVAADSKNFYRLNLGSHTKFDQSLAMLGTTFTALGRLGGKCTYYISYWNPPYRFDWGLQPELTDFSFELTQHDGGTKVYFSRVHDLSIIESILGLIGLSKRKKSFQNNVRLILKSLKGICENEHY